MLKILESGYNPSVVNPNRLDGRWMTWARVAPGPKGRRQIYSRMSQADADARAKQVEEENQSISTPAPQFPVGTFAEFVYEVYVPHVFPEIRKTSERRYWSQLSHHILPTLGQTQIAEFGYAEMKRHKDTIRTRSGKVSKTLTHEVVMRTREIMNLYIRIEQARGGKTREDWRLVEPPAKPKKKKREEQAEDFTLRFMAACLPWERGPHFAALVLGLRRGEVCGFRKDKINRKKLTITVSEQHQPEYGDQLVETKGAERTIDIPKELLDAIDRYSDPNSVYVFTMPRPGRGHFKEGHQAPMGPILPNSLSKLTPAICERAGLPKTGFHDLRSYAATNLAALDLDPWAVAEILGHTKLETTMIYVNPKKESKREALRQILCGMVDPCAVNTGLTG